MNTIEKLYFITSVLFDLCDKIEDKNFDLTEEQADNIVNYSKDIRKDLQRSKTLEKAVEIIKNKKVDIKLFIGIITALKENEKALEYYNCVNNKQLTQQEFDLLKEVFNNDK